STRDATPTSSSSTAARSPPAAEKSCQTHFFQKRVSDTNFSMPVQPAHLAKIHPMRGGEEQARHDADGRLDRRGPEVVAVDPRDHQQHDGADPDADDVGAAVHAVSKRETESADRHDEPKHEPVEMPAAEPERGDGQNRD